MYNVNYAPVVTANAHSDWKQQLTSEVLDGTKDPSLASLIAGIYPPSASPYENRTVVATDIQVKRDVFLDAGSYDELDLGQTSRRTITATPIWRASKLTAEDGEFDIEVDL